MRSWVGAIPFKSAEEQVSLVLGVGHPYGPLYLFKIVCQDAYAKSKFSRQWLLCQYSTLRTRA